jgi:choline-sulfatase
MATGGHPAQNLLLLTVDAWRADFVDDFAGVPLAPTLQGLLPRALRFDRAYANGPWTSPGLLSLFTGQSPFQHGVHFEWSAPPPGTPSLCRRLGAAGYHTPNICYLNRVGNYQNLGYSAEGAPDYPKDPGDDRLLRAIAETPEPWFLWYHYKFIHLPYWPAPRYRQLFSVDEEGLPAHLRDSVCSKFVVPKSDFPLQRDDREPVRRLYAGGVRQMDDFLARVLTALAGRGLDERTTLCLTADHGDELLEHGHVGHASTSHHATLYEEVLHIPLFIADPRLSSGRRLAARVQQADLFSTLLSLCGVKAPGALGTAVDLSPLVLAGREPAELASPRPFLFLSSRMGYQTPRTHEAQRIWAVSDGQRKFIREEFDAPRRQLFDLLADPHEARPSADETALDEAESWARACIARDASAATELRP